MASGLLGKAALAAATDTNVYTVPAGKVATVNIYVVNRGAADAVVNVAVTPDASVSTDDYIEFGAVVPANGGVLERTAIPAGAGENVFVRDSAGTCTAQVRGFEA